MYVVLMSCSFKIDVVLLYFFFFKQKTAYEMRISDWSSDVCSSDLRQSGRRRLGRGRLPVHGRAGRNPDGADHHDAQRTGCGAGRVGRGAGRRGVSAQRRVLGAQCQLAALSALAHSDGGPLRRDAELKALAVGSDGSGSPSGDRKTVV